MPLTTDDKVEIGELLSAYCCAIDAGRFDEVRDFFTDDCVIDFGAVMGRHEGPGARERFVELLAQNPIRMRHYVTNFRIQGDGDRARAESYVLAMTGEPGALMPSTGRYEDELVKQDGRWKLRSRIGVIELPGI